MGLARLGLTCREATDATCRAEACFDDEEGKQMRSLAVELGLLLVLFLINDVSSLGLQHDKWTYDLDICNLHIHIYNIT